MKKLNGQKEAAKIDNKINKLLKKHPITSKTNFEWSQFIQKMIASLYVIKMKLKRRENK